MRHQLGLTQAGLAQELKVALPTVGRWESWDPPRGIILERLARFAEFHGLPVAADFRYVIDKELTRALPVWFRMETDQETEYVKALLLILREKKYAELLPELRKLMMPALEATVDESEDRHLRLAKAEKAESEAEKVVKIKRPKKTKAQARGKHAKG
jgi:hypothetical protein